MSLPGLSLGRACGIAILSTSFISLFHLLFHFSSAWLSESLCVIHSRQCVPTIGLVLREQSVLFERMTESQFSGIVLPGLTKTGSDEIVNAIGADDNMLGAMTVQLSSVTASFKKQTEHAESQASEIW